MSARDEKMKEILMSSPKGERLAGDLSKIINRVGTAENLQFLQKAQNSPRAAQAGRGDARAMADFMKELMNSDQGQAIVSQIKQMTEE